MKKNLNIKPKNEKKKKEILKYNSFIKEHTLSHRQTWYEKCVLQKLSTAKIIQKF